MNLRKADYTTTLPVSELILCRYRRSLNCTGLSQNWYQVIYQLVVRYSMTRYGLKNLT